MKKKLLITTTALFGIISTFYATPAFGQWVREILVRNIDERGRNPYMEFRAVTCPGNGSVQCQVIFPPVPAGKRLVLERVNASINFTTHGIRVAALLAPQDVLFVLPAHPAFDPNVFVVNESTLTYFESGQSPVFHLVVNNAEDIPVITAAVSGYLVDIAR